MPYALCPMPYARRVPHVTEKGYRYLRINLVDGRYCLSDSSIRLILTELALTNRSIGYKYK